jgi:hypothetical protein
MKLVSLIKFLRDRLRLVVRVCLAVLVLLVLIDAVPGIVHKEHAHTAAEHWPGFWAVFGFIGCAVLILASKAFGHAGIMQREDYYDE